MTKPPRTAYLTPKDGGSIDRHKLIKFLLCSIDNISDPKVNAAYYQVLGEVNSGRVDLLQTNEQNTPPS